MQVSFSRLQLIFLLLLSLGISNHVLIIPHLLQEAGRDAWVSILAAYVILIGWSFFLYLILKSMGITPFNSWLEAKSGKIGYWIIVSGLTLYLLVAGTMIIFDTVKNINIFFLPSTPNAVIIFSFIILSFGAARSGLKTLIYLSILLLPIVWILGIGVSFMTVKSKDYSMLYPLFTEGFTPDLRGIVIVFGGSIDLMILLLLQHKLKKPLNYGTVAILLTLLAGLIMGPTIGSITAFGPFQAANMRFPAFEQWRLVMIGNHISHVDFLAAFQLMAGSVMRTALIIFLAAELIGYRMQKYKQAIMVVATLIMALPSIMQLSDIRAQKIIHSYFYGYSFWFGVMITAALLVIAYFPRKKADIANENVT